MAKQTKDTKLVVIEVSIQTIWDASKPLVHKSKKTYTRKGRKRKIVHN